MVNYLREQSVGDVLRNSLEIYRRNFGVTFLTFLLPTLPTAIWQDQAVARYGCLSVPTAIATFPAMITSIVGWGALTVAVSDICLGNNPSVTRSYKRVFSGTFATLFLASLLQTIIAMLGCCLLIVPGVVATLWMLFTPSVVVLERLSVFQSLKRSKRLGDGYHWRNLRVFVVVFVLWMLVLALVGVLFGIFWPHHDLAMRLCSVGGQLLVFPMMFIPIILLYYDLRVRKEAYDGAALAEDLRR